jgi:hypothetical protein
MRYEVRQDPYVECASGEKVIRAWIMYKEQKKLYQNFIFDSSDSDIDDE